MARDDVGAFEELYRRWAETVAAYLVRHTGSWDSAADLTASTFLVAWERRAAFRDLGRPGVSWLFGIARRELGRFRRDETAARRAAARWGVQVPEWDEEAMRRVEDALDAETWRPHLAEAIASLSEGERRALGLRVVAGFSYAEVAEALNLSEGAVRVRVHRVLRNLSTRLGGAMSWGGDK
jgi:RNA polymerase sigma-70 factor (ECF subfamily)